MSTTPQGLLARAAGGDEASVRECLSRFGSLVWGLARRMSPTRADAEDAVQDIFLDLWAHGRRYDPERASEEAFVAVIARRRLIDRRRKLARRPATESIDALIERRGDLPEAPQGSTVESSAEAALTVRAMSHLRPEQREVLRLSIAQGLTHEEIAQHTGMPLGTVKAHSRRGLTRIRARLLGELDVDDVVTEEEAR